MQTIIRSKSKDLIDKYEEKIKSYLLSKNTNWNKDFSDSIFENLDTKDTKQFSCLKIELIEFVNANKELLINKLQSAIENLSQEPNLDKRRKQILKLMELQNHIPSEVYNIFKTDLENELKDLE